MSLVCMAYLRRLSSRALLARRRRHPAVRRALARACASTRSRCDAIWCFLFVGGRRLPSRVRRLSARPVALDHDGRLGARPLGPRDARPRSPRRARGRSRSSAWRSSPCSRSCAASTATATGACTATRSTPLQWLHVAKYPPSLSYTTLELGLTFLLLALFFADRRRATRGRCSSRWRSSARRRSSITSCTRTCCTWRRCSPCTRSQPQRPPQDLRRGRRCARSSLYPLCVRYRRYKAAHPDGWTRYI